MKRITVIGFGGWMRAIAALGIMLAAGAAVGILWARNAGPAPGEPTETAGAPADETWYTCGMHPQVLQREPGICPICNMKLTPKKKDDGGGEDASTGPQERKVLYWRAPMDPGYVSDRPGKSPMGMDLVPVYADAGEVVGGPIIRIDPVTIQNMGIRTARVRRGPLVKTIRTVGRIDYDEQRLVYVDTKIAGWIEKLHVDETGQRVKAGDPLFEVYSPDLYSAQVEYISALRRLPTLQQSTFPQAVDDAQRMVDAGRLKLEYFDVPGDLIDRLAETLTPEKTLEIRSPADGIVAEKMAIEGMRIMPGMRLYTVADLSRVWVYVDVYEYQLPWVHVGQTATMTLPYVPGKVFRGEVAYIYPYLQKQTRVIKVRLEFANPTQELKPDMYANVVLEGMLHDDAVLIPREGYIDSGTRQVAFVDRGGGKYEPRDIQVGVEGEGGMVEVLMGLEAGEVVVTSGQFLLDSESKLKEAVAKMAEPRRVPPKQRPPGKEAIELADAKYACPMDRHPDEEDPADRGPYVSNQPGDCPLCGMKLAPIEQLEWAQAILSAGGAEVGYTCPNHQNVFSESPGECPVCGAVLEPFKAIYTCRNPKHARQTSDQPADCPECGEPMAVYRGPWLGEAMAALNPTAEMKPEGSPPLTSHPADDERGAIPAGARFVCPMQECWQFASTEGRCPTCGMKLKPISEVAWAAKRVRPAKAPVRFVCPMHPKRAESDEPGVCPICAMELIPEDRIVGLEEESVSIDRQVDYLIEHYLGLQELFARDSTDQAARHALGLVDASEKLDDLLRAESEKHGEELVEAVGALHQAALKIRGADLTDDRSHFAKLSAAMRIIVEHSRPDRTRWPALYIYHCPMSQADWIQRVEKKANPYYGFKMLDCGKLVEKR